MLSIDNTYRPFDRVVIRLYSYYAKVLTPFPFKHLYELLLGVTYFKKSYVAFAVKQLFERQN